MSAPEVAKHAVKSYQAVKEKGKSRGQRLLSFSLELLIIVFAISVSLLLERWREKVHDREVEKNFFMGFRQDLESDIKEMQIDMGSYELQGNAAAYLLNNKKYNADSLNLYFGTLFSYTKFLSNSSRFEALKSSGKLYVIHNEELLNEIMELYQEKIPSMMMEVDFYLQVKYHRLIPYIEDNFKQDAGIADAQTLFQSVKGTNLLKAASATTFIVIKYQHTIDHTRKLIAMIDAELK